ncbi:hypothetical protein GPECTOR_12g361 [Gonium pectorale]|uniref:Uncharacterized protein n=1 Tax=Gonium pectorale TaxID=33097 RepID=A0A150GNK1_GONPE|nr:hypothetical protein GPECTOR_12g361 [Gonium pectorale]|eukprot:KXZ51399.1 hypothetical protein GPECTOR_12g361 [Gonium pectorale]
MKCPTSSGCLSFFARGFEPNEIVCTLCLVDKATAEQFLCREGFTIVRLSQPVPAHAFAKRWGSPGGMRVLSRISPIATHALAAGNVAAL